MKKILFTLLMLYGVAQGQSKLYLRGDSIQMQSGTNSELILLNGSRTVTNGILTNIGNGRTKFLPIDSFSVGGTLNNIGTGFDLAISGTSNVKRVRDSLYLKFDSSINNTLRAYIDTTTMFPLVRGTVAAKSLQAVTEIGNTTDKGIAISSGTPNVANALNIRRSGMTGAAVLENYGGTAGSTWKVLSFGGSTLSFVAHDTSDQNITIRNVQYGPNANVIAAFQRASVDADSGSNNHLQYIILGEGLQLSNGVLSATAGSTPTWQSVLDNGSILDKANTVDQADFLLTWLGPNRWYDSTATQVSIRDFNSGIDYLTYTPILGDTVINFTMDVVNGIKLNATDGSETHYLQVKGNGIYAGGLVFNDDDALRGIAIDTTTGKFYTVPIGGSSSTPGIDDVLAVGQSLTASRSVDLDGESVSFSDGFNTTSIGSSSFSSQYVAGGFTHSTTLTNYQDYFQALTANQGSTRSVLIETSKDWYGKIGVIAPGGTSYTRVDSTQVEINTSNLKLTGRVFSDAASLRSLVIDTTTGLVYTAPLGSGGSSISFGTDNQIPYMNSDGDDFDYSANLTFDGQSMVVTNTNVAFSTNYILTVAGEEGNDAAMLRLKGAGNRSAYIGLGASDHMIFKNNHGTSATAGFVFFNRLGASLASFTNTVAHLPFGVIVNDAGGDFDFRVESDGDTHNIFSDGGNNRVGIGTGTPGEKLDVNGNIAASGGKVGASLENDVTPVSTTGSSEENLITYALPAGKLATDGDYIEVSASFLVQTVSDKIYLKFGSTNVVEWTAGNIGTYMVYGTITRTGAATQEARFMIVGEDTGVAITSPTETLSGSITIAGAAEVGGSSGTQYNLNVKYYPAN